MADYTQALQEGFEAAKKADASRREIREVLTVFKEQVEASCDGKLLLEVRTFEQDEPVNPYSVILMRSAQNKKTYQAIVATNPKAEKSSVHQLARWKLSREGYPCSLDYGQEERQFEDRAALEEGLAEMLRDPRIGEILFKLVNRG